MKYGNCFSGAIYIMIKMRSWKIRCVMFTFPDIPHFYVIKNGKRYHYEPVRYVLPFPFGLFFFQGRIRRYIKRSK